MPRARQVAVTGVLGVLLVGWLATSAEAGPGSGFRVTGVPVQAVQADDAKAAANLAVTVTPGRYRIDLAGDGAMRWVAVERATGAGLWITAVTPASGANQDELRIEVATPDGHACATETAQVSSEDGLRAPVPACVLIDPATVDEDCSRADRLLVGTAREPGAGGEPPAELHVLEEPRVRDAGALPGPLNDVDEGSAPAWSDSAQTESAQTESAQTESAQTESAQATAVSGGASFTAAPVLHEGRYSDTIGPGGIRLYRVQADFGQRVETALHVPGLATGEASDLPDGLKVTVAVFGPGQRLLVSNEGSLSRNSDATVGAAAPTVRHRNRESSDESIKAASVGGPHYVLVAAQNADGSGTFPYRLDVQVTGDISGTPAYTGAGAPHHPVSADATRAAARAPGFWPIVGPVLVGIAAAGTVGGIGLRLRRRP